MTRTVSPFEEAWMIYQKHPQQQTFSEYHVWHCQNGFVYSTPSFFIMGRPAVKQSLENIGPTFANERFPDTWFIHTAAGDLKKAWSILPYYLPYIAFQRVRGGELSLTIVLTDRIRNLTELIVT